MAVDTALHDAVVARSSSAIDADWLEQAFNEAMVYVRLLAPCKRAEWLDYTDLPTDVQIVVMSALARMAMNPRNYRQETIGEYSYTVGTGSVGANGPFSSAEARIIGAASGCGGSFKSVQMTTPDQLVLEIPESGTTDWQEGWMK